MAVTLVVSVGCAGEFGELEEGEEATLEAYEEIPAPLVEECGLVQLSQKAGYGEWEDDEQEADEELESEPIGTEEFILMGDIAPEPE